jgi:nucleoid DNA-binding protein
MKKKEARQARNSIAKEMTKNLYKTNRLCLYDCRFTLNVILKIMAETLAKREPIILEGWGRFEVYKKKARTIKGKFKYYKETVIHCEEKFFPRFVQGERLKNYINSDSEDYDEKSLTAYFLKKSKKS